MAQVDELQLLAGCVLGVRNKNQILHSHPKPRKPGTRCFCAPKRHKEIPTFLRQRGIGIRFRRKRGGGAALRATRAPLRGGAGAGEGGRATATAKRDCCESFGQPTLRHTPASTTTQDGTLAEPTEPERSQQPHHPGDGSTTSRRRFHKCNPCCRGRLLNRHDFARAHNCAPMQTSMCM